MVKRSTAICSCISVAVVTASVIMSVSVCSAAKRSLNFWTPVYNPTAQQWYEKVAAPAFEAKYGIKVKYRYLTWDVYVQQTLAAISAGSGPDVFVVSAETMPFWSHYNLVKPLTAYVRSWKQQDDFLSSAWKSSQYRGIQMGIPYTVHAKTMLYRKDIFAESGIGAQGPDTWDDATKYAVKMTRRDGNKVTRLGLLPPYFQDYACMVWSLGGEILSEDLSTARFNSKEGLYALKLRLQANDLQVPKGIELSIGADWTLALPNKKLAMGWFAPNFIGAWQTKTPNEMKHIAVGLPPMGVERVCETHTTKLAISKSCQQPDIAWKFIAFLVSPDNHRTFCDALERFPTRKSLKDAAFITKSASMTKFMSVMTDYGRPWIETVTDFSRLASEIEGKFHSQVMTHKKSPEDVLRESEEYVNRELKRRKL